jgi:hypothetical protein
MPKPLKAWPVEAYNPYREIIKRQSVIAAMVDVSIREGVNEHNKHVVSRLAPIIYRRAREIQGYCQDICSLLEQDRQGRYPRWFTTTLDIHARAMVISELIESEVNPALRRNELIYIGSILKCLKVETEAIKKYLEQNPYRPGLEIWEDAIEEALKER